MNQNSQWNNSLSILRSWTVLTKEKGKTFFSDAPGGTGKTFLTKLIRSRVRSTNRIAIATASCGIAATLLQNGKTAHSTFKLPLNLKHQENQYAV